MKRFLALYIVVVLLVVMAIPASAAKNVVSDAEPQVIRLGNSVKIDDVCTFTIKTVKEYDVFFNEKSGDASQFLVISFDIINWKTEPLYLRTEMKARLNYDDSFDFDPSYLWANPVGTYYWSGRNAWKYIYTMDDLGGFISNHRDQGGGYVRPQSGEEFYFPEVDVFDTMNNGVQRNPNNPADHYVSIDSSKTVFDPLVQRTMHYVFTVPNIVAKDEGLRMLTLSIAGNDYQLRF